MVDAAPIVVPAGTGSFNVTFVAAAGPLLVTVIRKIKELPTSPGFGDAVFVIDRSTLEALTTFKFTWVECISKPDWPVIVIKLLATGVVAFVLIVSVVVFAFASVIFTVVGLNVADAPIGSPVALRLTMPVNAAKGVIVIVYCADPPGTMFLVDGVAVIAKSAVADSGDVVTKVL